MVVTFPGGVSGETPHELCHVLATDAAHVPWHALHMLRKLLA